MHDHMQMHDEMGMSMPAAIYGSYTHSRDASGTAWQPDSSPVEGWHFTLDNWALMFHGFADVVYDDQGGKRGDSKTFSPNMFMLMGNRPVGDGRFGFKSMLSLDPLMGKSGYPLLLQTGETANGEDELVDRQHPHDMFMEMALTYELPLSTDASLFGYFGLPGEPALGPATFMHRSSGQEIPDAPISHHWLDSTHVTFGVATLGVVYRDFKLDGSAFNGREPDQNRYDIETRALDSYSGRLTYNFNQNSSAQVSYGNIQSPEQLEPEIDVDRYTASYSYNLPLPEGNWGTTLAFGTNRDSPGSTLPAYLVESSLVFNEKNTIIARFENVRKDHLFPQDRELDEKVFTLNRLALGYIYDIAKFSHLKVGLGSEVTFSILDSTLDRYYGEDPVSFLIFARTKII